MGVSKTTYLRTCEWHRIIYVGKFQTVEKKRPLKPIFLFALVVCLHVSTIAAQDADGENLPRTTTELKEEVANSKWWLRWWESLAVSKKALAVLIVVFAGVVIGCVINFVNLHTDFQDLQDFHRGYLGRRLLIREGKLQSRRFCDAVEKVRAARNSVRGQTFVREARGGDENPIKPT